MTGSQKILDRLRDAREKIQAALIRAQFEVVVKLAEAEQRRYVCEWKYSVPYPQ
jgi:hypothetical protein